MFRVLWKPILAILGIALYTALCGFVAVNIVLGVATQRDVSTADSFGDGIAFCFVSLTTLFYVVWLVKSILDLRPIIAKRQFIRAAIPLRQALESLKLAVDEKRLLPGTPWDKFRVSLSSYGSYTVLLENNPTEWTFTMEFYYLSKWTPYVTKDDKAADLEMVATLTQYIQSAALNGTDLVGVSTPDQEAEPERQLEG